jgi:acetyl esterase/lipase
MMTTATFSVDVSADHVYAEAGARPLRADLYLPRDTTHPPPVIVWLHSGGWRVGDRRRAPDLSHRFAAHGFAMASIDYRLSREATFPAQLDDVKSALRWLRDNAKQHGIDGRRIGLWGSSAGGHLAALAGLGADDARAPLPAVRAVVVGYAPIDFLQMDAQRDRGLTAVDDPSAFSPPPGAFTADADSYESLLIGAPIEERPDLARAASPLTYVREGAPPFLIVHGLSDSAVPSQQSVQLYEALARRGNDVTLQLVEGLGHGFLDRDDFDRGPRRRVEMYRARKGMSEHTDDGPPLTFDTIEAFFRQHFGSDT